MHHALKVNFIDSLHKKVVWYLMKTFSYNAKMFSKYHVDGAKCNKSFANTMRSGLSVNEIFGGTMEQG